MMDTEALVCVVEDDAPLRASLTNLLRSVGLRVAAFASALSVVDHPSQPVT
jgi:FixJ family two-component response regulator